MDDNETWIIEEGDRVIEKESRCGIDGLTAWERLVYCLWVADYGMRNAGDLRTARDVFADFQSVACQAAEELSLQFTLDAFSSESHLLETRYFEQFDGICDEIKSIKPPVD